ncbi:LOW QUALITY PROTEIN: very-long-chain 3-oxoacyl-CoA reductase-like [Mantella aurantiaca]
MSDSALYQGLTLLGFLALGHLVLKYTFKLLMGFRVHILWWRKDLTKYGGWAVITGATDGIGKCYAKELAKMGFNVVLISRTLEKLQKVAAEIEQQSGCKAKIIQADFTGGAEIYPKIEEGLKDLDIGILVNNVGMINKIPKIFLRSDDLNKDITNLVNCNVLSMLHMTRIILPRMVERKKGLIINISSEMGTRPYPMGTLYCSTKVFMDYFSRSLNMDYKPKGVTVQSVMPLVVSTKMTENMESNVFVKTADDFAREALNTAGLTNRTSGCLSHSIQSFLLDLFLTETILKSRIIAWIGKLTLRAMERRQKLD